MQESKNWSIPEELAGFLENALSARDIFINLISLNRQNPGKISLNSLEFGTGAGKATEILSRYSRSVHTFDASEHWSKFAQEKLTNHKNIAYHVGYDPDLLPKGTTFSFVLIDGPRDGKGKPRETALIRFWDRIEPGALVIMDDCRRHNEKEALKTWKSMWGIDYIIHDIGRGIGVFIK